jgi:hypothetical protein
LSDAAGALRFAVAGLAVWRVTHLLAYEDGPADVIAKLRMRAGGGQLGELMDCFGCLSIWVAVPFALFAARRPTDRVVSWLALSGAACLVEQITTGREEIVDLTPQSGGQQHGLLQPEANGNDRPSEPAG